MRDDGINRRDLLTGVTSTAILGLSGCTKVAKGVLKGADDVAASDSTETTSAGIEEDDGSAGQQDATPVEVLELVQAESNMVSIDSPSEHTYTATLQNTGRGGDLAVSLYWQMSESGSKPGSVDHEGGDAYSRVRKKTFYFDSGERRTVEFVAEPPSDAVGYYFLTQPGTYGARIKNPGEGRRVNVEMTYKTAGVGIEDTSSQTVYIDSSSTKLVTFDTVIMPESEWEIVAEPA